MMRLMMGLACLGLMTLISTTHAQGPAESSYYPLKPGTKWTYVVQGTTIVMKVEKLEKIGETMCAKIDTIINEKSVANEHVAVAADGIYRHAINGMVPASPVKFFALPVKVDGGDSWTVDTKIKDKAVKGKFVTKKEKVKVPAGEYDAIQVDGADFEIDGQKTSVKFWFADKVGIVKLSFSLGGMDATLELEKFEAAK
ncbi:DUF3108 domain-containing protein [Tuwongella immobilis]|uniref:Lipid/polyisoprenoid-binding YceI-like domain-containing protein n=1 Tax=Tuwongella immobilis TaxID=692036 RepID=A0A6C2YH78_9BACT|nr:DUF3108 domain-containing protein [Tuwongella immobilis]VIP00846.1 Uncharacterized protein OS=Pirellula staleyi (strain ATCC 27377 / DSM 6068 / ICPB 4128) GN=Psta_2333 PE=4 SV=1: DUF3108 [Tuwongella immobilis]VTR97110.1 Uncharacterized protein OS=Pirellula staleyi (strain ATCC 27377 / DSM 6068 / ICPB 4128) GN=Psta_2333 PE=4 SV=1: DUF3108 [Tuwongella immobilis]